MTGQAEVADLHRLCGIAEIVDLEHAVAAPARYTGDQKADAAVALPPALVRVLVVAADAGDELGVSGLGYVPDFMRQPAERTQQIDRVRIRPGQALAVANARHLRAAGLRAAVGTRNMRKIFRLRRIGDVDDRGAVELRLSVDPIDRLGHVARAVMAYIGDVAIPLLVNGRLVGAACLQIIEADEP